MTNMGELEELEPLDGGSGAQAPTPAGAAAAAPPAATGPEPAAAVQRSGLAAPAYNPRADKFYFRFFFAGLLMVLGCMMPFGPEWDMTGNKTLPGVLTLVIGLGICWSSWGAIHTNRFDPKHMKWILFAVVPLILFLMGFLNFTNEPAIKSALAAGIKLPSTIGELFSAVTGSLPLVSGDEERLEAGARLDNFVRYYGSGKIVVLLGALLAELFFFKSIFGAAKVMKEQKAAAIAARQGQRA